MGLSAQETANTIAASNCNTSGIFDGCFASRPYSCAASSTCHATALACAQTTVCKK